MKTLNKEELITSLIEDGYMIEGLKKLNNFPDEITLSSMKGIIDIGIITWCIHRYFDTNLDLLDEFNFNVYFEILNNNADKFNCSIKEDVLFANKLYEYYKNNNLSNKYFDRNQSSMSYRLGMNAYEYSTSDDDHSIRALSGLSSFCSEWNLEASFIKHLHILEKESKDENKTPKEIA